MVRVGKEPSTLPRKSAITYQCSRPLFRLVDVVHLEVAPRQTLHEVPPEAHVPLGGRLEGQQVALGRPRKVLLDVGIVRAVLCLEGVVGHVVAVGIASVLEPLEMENALK